MLVMGDHLVSAAHVLAVISGAQSAGESCVLATSLPGLRTDNDDATKVLTEPGGRILEIGKMLPRYNAIDTGVFSMTPRIFDALDLASTAGDASLTAGNRLLAEAGHLLSHSIDTLPWQDVDTSDDLSAAERLAGSMGDGDDASGTT